MSALDCAPRHSARDIERFVAAGYWTDETLVSVVEGWARRSPDHPAIVTPDRSISYAEFLAAGRRLANSLRSHGIGPDDVVGIQLPNVPEFMIAHLALCMMGGILGTLHMQYRAGELAPLMRHAGMKALICGTPTDAYDAPATALALRAQVPTLEHVFVLGGVVPAGCHSFASMIDEGSDTPLDWTPQADDHFILFYTSGTAAAPKGVVSTYRRFMSNARIYGGAVGLGPEDVVMLVPAFTHVFGTAVTDFALYAGATNLLVDRFTPTGMLERIQAGRPSMLFCAPAHLAATLKTGELANYDCSSVRCTITGGALCPPSVAEAFERALPNGRVGQLFGMTEVLLGAQTPMAAGPEVRHHSVGRPLEGIEMRVSMDDSSPCAEGAEGELQVRGHTVLAGYLDNDEANRLAFTGDGWFKTGDLAMIDKDSNVIVTGRVKDVINRGGVKINPTDIENAMTAHPSVVLAAIVPEYDNVLGERCCLFVELAPGASLTLADATAWLASKGIAKMLWPERLEVVDEMPMTPTRKILKRELARQLETARA